MPLKMQPAVFSACQNLTRILPRYNPLRKIGFTVSLCVIGLLLTGCGQKGPLTLPPPATTLNDEQPRSEQISGQKN